MMPARSTGCGEPCRERCYHGTEPRETRRRRRGPAVVTRQIVGDAVALWWQHGGLLNACVLARSSDTQLDVMWRDFVEPQTQPIIVLLSGLRGVARTRPKTDDLAALIDVLLGMTVWALLDETTKLRPTTDTLTRSPSCGCAVWGGR